MSVGNYSHITRATGTVLTATIYNGDHQNHITNQNPTATGAYSDSVAQMQTNTDPGGVGTESLAGSLAGELERLRFAIKRIAGGAQWYSAPTNVLTNPSNTTQALTDGATINWDTSLGAVATVTIAGNRTLAAPTNLKVGGQYVLTVTQDGTGGRTLTWNAVFKGTGGAAMPQPTLFASAVSIFLFESDGTNLFLTGVTDLTNPGNTDQTLTDAANIDWNANLGAIATVTLGGNRNFNAPTNLKKGFYALHIVQDGTGGRTATFNAVFKWLLGVAPSLSTAANAHDVIFFVSDGTNLYGVSVLNASTTSTTVTAINLFKRGALGMAQANTFYGQCVGKAADGTESNGEAYVLEPMTLSELRAVASAAVPAANTVVFTVRKNGADTALTCTIGATQTAASDITHSVDFGQGDSFAIKIVSSATAGTNDYKATVRAIQLSTTKGLSYLQFSGSGGGGGAVSVSEANGGADSLSQSSVPLPRCLVSYPTFPVAGVSGGLAVYHNEVVQPTLWALDSAAVESAQLINSPRFLFADMDTIALSGSGAVEFRNAVVNLKSADPATYDPCPVLFSSRNQTQATTVFSGGYGGNNLFNATENKVQIAMPACTVKKLRISTDTTPAAGQTVTVTVRKNGVDTAVTAQITNGGGRTASDLTNSVTFAAGDLLSLKFVTSATVGTRFTNASIEVFV